MAADLKINIRKDIANGVVKLEYAVLKKIILPFVMNVIYFLVTNILNN
jgi:hypothetical protein